MVVSGSVSPPEYPDLYGRRRETARVQMLEREIGFLEEDLKSVESLQPASQICKEIADFVVENADPLILKSEKSHRSCRFWKWLCVSSCPTKPCDCCSCWPSIFVCRSNNCKCSSISRSNCFKTRSCSTWRSPSCPSFSCCWNWKCCFPKCGNVGFCCRCKTCCCCLSF